MALPISNAVRTERLLFGSQLVDQLPDGTRALRRDLVEPNPTLLVDHDQPRCTASPETGHGDADPAAIHMGVVSDRGRNLELLSILRPAFGSVAVDQLPNRLKVQKDDIISLAKTRF